MQDFFGAMDKRLLSFLKKEGLEDIDLPDYLNNQPLRDHFKFKSKDLVLQR